MKTVAVIFALVVACSATDLKTRTRFNEFVAEHGKQYESPAHYHERMAIFSENLKMIEEHNAEYEAGRTSWYMAVNKFADLTHDEFKAQYASGLLNIAKPQGLRAAPKATHKMNLKDLPEKKDWRDDGVVTAVKDQGMCGSCWAFATVETLESYLALESGEPAIELSPQQIVSCTPNPLKCGGTGGCSGSIPEIGFSYSALFGIVTEEEYPYTSGHTGRTGDCQYDAESQVASAYNRGYETLPHNDFDVFMEHVATKGPLAISSDASRWSFYSGGVFDGCSYDKNIEINHAIQVVGYDSDPVHGDYWIVRNSWGSNWGDGGYIKLKRETEAVCGTDSTPMMGTGCDGDGNSVQKVCGQCGILFDNSYPIGTAKESGIKP